MTPEQRLTLLWLCNAMTLPTYYLTERYYYDGVTQSFFSRVPANNCGTRFTIKDHVGKRFYAPVEADLMVRMELTDDDMSEVVEIPRFRVKDKTAIQHLFMGNFPGVYYEQELLGAIDKLNAN